MPVLQLDGKDVHPSLDRLKPRIFRIVACWCERTKGGASSLTVGAESANPPVPNQALLSAARQVPALLVLLSFKSPVMKNGRFDLPNRGSPDRLSDMSQFAEKEALDYRSIASV